MIRRLRRAVVRLLRAATRVLDVADGARSSPGDADGVTVRHDPGTAQDGPRHVAASLRPDECRVPHGPFDDSVVDLVITVDVDDIVRRPEALARLGREADGSGMRVHAVAYEAEESIGRTHVTPVLPPGMPLVANEVTRGWSAALVRSYPLLSGTRVVVVDSSVEIEAKALRRLADVLADDVCFAQAVLRSPNDTVASAGALFGGPFVSPGALFAGFPQEDVRSLSPLDIDAADLPVFALRTADLHEPPATVDLPMAVTGLSLRVAERRGDGARVVSVESGRAYLARPSVRRLDPGAQDLLHEWRRRTPTASAGTLERAGLQLEAFGVLPTGGVPTRVGRPVLTRITTSIQEPPRRLRWALKTAAWAGTRGDDWGDVFFARDLAEGLRQLGQEVVIDNRQSLVRPDSEHLDDVSLVLRGLDRVPPNPHALNVLWVISHPDLVSSDELADFDLRYSAGPSWGVTTSRKTGLDVSTLLQATDPARFHPGEADEGLRSDVLFVGKTRNVFRPIVRDAVAAGLDLSVWGEGWSGLVADDVFRGEFLSNDRLAAAYRSARVVLNDHWADMAREGFISNRIFDAVATGATVISDEIDGLEAVFGDAVHSYHDVSELAALSRSIGGGVDDGRRQERAHEMAEKHSFVRRAGVLVEDVSRVLARHH